MKHACIVTAFKTYPGGVETFNSYLDELLTNNGYVVTYLTYEKDKYSLLEKVFKLVLGMPGITILSFKRNKYDVVIANGEFGFGIFGGRVINVFHGSLRGYYLTVRGLLPLKSTLSLFRGYLEQYFGAKKKYCVAVSEYARNDLETAGIAINDVIENCVDTDLFYPIPEIKRNGFLCVASYDYYRKGFDILNKISALMREHIDVVTNTNESFDHLTVIKNVNNNEMPSIYNRYSIFIFPSRYEAMQLAPLEAMACGVPVVISDVGLGPQLKKVIPDFVISGYDDKAVSEYKDKITNILNNYEKYSKLARKYVLENNSKEVFYKKWLTVINKVTDAH